MKTGFYIVVVSSYLLFLPSSSSSDPCGYAV